MRLYFPIRQEGQAAIKNALTRIIYYWEVVKKYSVTQNYVQKEENAIALALYLNTGYSDFLYTTSVQLRFVISTVRYFYSRCVVVFAFSTLLPVEFRVWLVYARSIGFFVPSEGDV